MSVHFETSVPATSANLGPGFDRLALAVALRLNIRATESTQWRFINRGEGASHLAMDAENLIARAYKSLCDTNGWQALPLSCDSDNLIPLGRGLGSSAAAIVSGMALAQLANSGSIDRDALLVAAAQFEGHPDNVAGAIYGGLQLATVVENRAHSEALPLSGSITLLLGIPSAVKSTEEIRKLIPATLSAVDAAATEDALRNVIEGLGSGDGVLLQNTENDRRHQPYRLEVLQQSRYIFDLFVQHPSIAGAYLSGAGTTIGGFIVNGDNPADELAGAIQEQQIQAAVKLIAVDHDGTRGSRDAS